MIPKIIIALCVSSVLQASAAPQIWKSADGIRSVQGEFVSRDATSVTIKRSADHKKVTIPLDQLHSDDRTSLNLKHPVPGTEPPPPSAVFDQLVFGDKRAQVLEKLKASEFLDATVAETFFGRTGLNDVFRTRGKIGGLDAMLFFDWDEDGGLKEITMRTPPLPASALSDQLIPCWKEFIDLLSTLHGKPASANAKLDLAPIQDGEISCTHLWKLENSASALLGASRSGDHYQVTVRFTTDDIKPIIIPETASTSAVQNP